MSASITPTQDALASVISERANQDAKWGEQNHNLSDWLVILGEEYGEACEASLEVKFGKGNIADFRSEIVQVAAVAVAILEYLERNHG